MSVTSHSSHQNSWSIKKHLFGNVLQLKAGDTVIKELSCKILQQNTKPSLLERIGITCRITLTIDGHEKIVRIWKVAAKHFNDDQSQFLQQNQITFVQIQNLLSLSVKESGEVFDQAFNLSKPIFSDTGRTLFSTPSVSYKTKGKTLQITKDSESKINFKIINDKGHDVTDQEITKLLKLDTWPTSGKKAIAISRIICPRHYFA